MSVSDNPVALEGAELGRFVIGSIRDGRIPDEFLDRIVQAVRRRREDDSLLLAEGDRVAVRPTVRPRYLALITGTVVGFASNGKILCRWDDQWSHYDNRGRDRLRGQWRMSPTSLSRIEG